MTIKQILHTQKPDKIVGEIMVRGEKTITGNWDKLYLSAHSKTCQYGQCYDHIRLDEAIKRFKDFYNLI